VTRKQRAQVVELLRCAADLSGGIPIYQAARALGISHTKTHHLAVLISGLVPACGYQHRLLEAAQRVEEGSYP